MTAPSPDFGSRTDFYTFAPETLAAELPDYEIVGEVGKGSMGIVFEARRRSDGERVALKVLPPSLNLTERALARFLREGELLRKVVHPAIVRALEHGHQGRLHYFVMEFVDGVTLEERVQVGPLPARQAAEIGSQVARALQFAHDHGVLHRDIKPGNLILRPDGRIAITDFGLARESGTGSMTESGAIVGTPRYMAPEQVVGDHGDLGTRSDVYGLGATLYHLVASEPPFTGSTAQAVLKDVLETEPRPPRRLRRDLPAALEAIILRALEKDPARRYGSAEEMADDLDRFLRGERVQARRPGPVRVAYRAAMRRPALTLLVLVVIVLSIGAYSLALDRRLGRLRASVHEAENKIALASGQRDDLLRTLTPADRQQALLEAVQITSHVISVAPDFALAWFVRAQARHRQQRYQLALADLDRAEELLGAPTAEILHFRIDTLRRLGGPRSRILKDLTRLLELDRGPHTECIATEHLLDLATEATGADRREILDRAARVLNGLPSDQPRVAIGKARLLELRGDLNGAEHALEAARATFHGDPLVHRQAALMFRRLGKEDLSEAEQRLARMLDPLGPTLDAPACEEQDKALDVRQVQEFLERIDDLFEALDPARPNAPRGAGR